MHINTRSALLMAIAGTVVALYAGAYFLNHQEDFSIYLMGSQALVDSKNPYLATDNKYIYGPFLAIFLVPLSFIDLSAAKILWGILNLSSGLTIAWLLLRLRFKLLGQNDLLIVLILILTSFSFRNNAGQGQAVSLMLVLSLFTVLTCQSKSKSSITLTALAILPVIEIKPYLALGLIAYLFFSAKKRVLVYLAASVVIANTLYFIFFKITYLDWLRALENRSKSVASGYDQSSIISILTVNTSMSTESRLVSVFLFYAVIFLLSFKYQKNIRRNPLPFFLVIPGVASPFLHAHDLLFTVAGFLLVVSFERKNFSSQSALLFSILVLHIGWTSDYLVVGFFLCVLVAVSLSLSGVDLSRLQLFGILGASSAWLVAFHFAFDLSNYSRVHAYNIFSLIYACLVFLYVIRAGSEKMSVLSSSRDNLDWDS